MYFATVGFVNKQLKSTHSSPLSNLLAINPKIDLVLVSLNLLICVVILMERNIPRRHRVVNFLIAHLSCLNGFNVVINWFNTGKEVNLINVPGELCGFVSFLKNVMHSTLFVNMVVTTYERLQSFSDDNISSSRRAKQLIFTIWSVSALVSVPTARMTTGAEHSLVEAAKYNTSNELLPVTCKSVELMGFWEATVSYEILRCLLFYFGTGLYLIYASIKIRLRLQYLDLPNISVEELEQHKRYNRIIYFYLFSFCMIQLPSEILLITTKLFLQNFDANHAIVKPILEKVDMYLFPALAFYMHMIPLVSFLILLGLKFPSWMCFCRQRQRPGINNEQEDASNIVGAPEGHQLVTCGGIAPNVGLEEPIASGEVLLNVEANILETSM